MLLRYSMEDKVEIDGLDNVSDKRLIGAPMAMYTKNKGYLPQGKPWTRTELAKLALIRCRASGY